MEKTEKTKKLLSTFQRRLTNLSGSNRSLLLLRTSDQFLDIHQLSFLSGEKSFAIVEALLSEKTKVICPLADARMEAANAMSRGLKKLARSQQYIFEERGSHDLHVGWPFVSGKFQDGTSIRCPLLFFPVELAKEKNNWCLRLKGEEGVFFNKSFLLAYAFYNKTSPDEKLLNETFDEVDRESTAFVTSLYNILQASGLEINFNADNYSNELRAFEVFKKQEFEDRHFPGQLKLFPEAVIGIFPQAGSSLVPDYMQLIEEASFEDLEDFFSKRHGDVGEAKNSNFVPFVREEKMYTVFSADIWQENAIKASKLGHSIVVQGPPGTGKSQLIGNLVSDAMANGKRTLVVCQKRAALDVVFARLKEKNLEHFLALVHDFKNDRKEIFEKLTAQINRTEEYKSKNISLDAIQLDRKFVQAGKRIDQITEELEQFRKALFDESECGCSVKELYLQCSADEPTIQMKQEYSRFKMNDIGQFLNTLEQYAVYARSLDGPWSGRISFAGFSAIDLPKINAVITEVHLSFQNTARAMQSTFNAAPDIEQVMEMSERLDDLLHLKNSIGGRDVFVYVKKMIPEKGTETSALWLSNVERMMMDCFGGDGLEASVPSALLGYFQKALHRAMKARRGLWSWLRWQVFSKDKIMITRALIANQLQSDKEGFKMLERKLDQRLNFEHNISKLKTKRWLLAIPETAERDLFVAWFAKQQKAIKAKSQFNSIRGLKNLINPINLKETEFHIRMNTLIQVLGDVVEKFRQWSAYLSKGQIAVLSRNKAFGDELLKLLNDDFDALCEFDKLKLSLSEDEQQVIERIREKAAGNDGQDWRKIFLNSLRLTWINHIETKHPELRIVSSPKMNALEHELQEQIETKQRLSNDILLLRARERVTDGLAFNRLHNLVSYRDLLHQVTKKKKIWPLRKAVSEFEEEIFKLLPCWLASPESVSAVFPMREIFDLVIFDEASQCFAERGIPAMYRGKQVVIAGDSKQLRPGDFYLARWDEEDFDEPDAEVASLLELSTRYLMTLRLNGHYRSQSLELIEFSNRHFYGGTLQLLPDFHHLNLQEPAIVYDKVNGVWKNNTNEIEARHVATLVWQITQTTPDKEIGIVTFNALQQSLVQDYLDDKFAAEQQALPEGLFVKNIENVQGDERDIIIFSVGYALDSRGKVSAQFGSLNTDGGENRLNVAVSRAREKIIVVTSLRPEELNVDETKNAGPKLLKAYLFFARDVSAGDFRSFVGNKSKHLSAQLKTSLSGHSLGLELREDMLPFCDLTVKQGKTFKGAIFTDDDQYYESLSAKAPHALLPLLLKKKNWPTLRVYSRNFWSYRKRLDAEIGNWKQ